MIKWGCLSMSMFRFNSELSPFLSDVVIDVVTDMAKQDAVS